MQPKTPHWADQAAARVIAQVGDKESYVVASGITPSGTVHIGNFREAITVDLVARALKDLGKKVRFVYSWDDFDTFRKVPVNLPNQEMLKKELRKPISRVPDPWGKEKSYARANEVPFERDIKLAGLNPEFLYQNERYSKGVYAQGIRDALENKEKIKEALNAFRSEPLAADWLPTSIYCEKCERDEMEYERYDGEWNYSYKCSSCGNETTTDIRKTQNLKLLWRADWPMRWNYEKVDFEPGGKDHSSEGGSYDTCKVIVEKVWGRKAPIYLQYDFVTIKGKGGKMSSSKGELLTLTEAFEVYPPQMVRWIFANQRPNHDFALAFDEDVIKAYDEFDRMEATAYRVGEAAQGRDLLARRCYELSLIDGKFAPEKPFRPGFRILCNYLQICDGDKERVLERFYASEIKTEADKKNYFERCEKAMVWLERYAPEEFRYRLNDKPSALTFSPIQETALKQFKSFLGTTDLETIDSKDLNQQIYDNVIKATGCDAKEFFQAVYQKLINRDQGPRLPTFLKEIGAKKLSEIL